ncbi:unnamed protein product [Gongylonema pulchrum]|uniref:Peptide chain release factor 2 n=1 Tax=Gongylonema pulchrum TaxID=637853 RepID=A0A183DXJ8_9BILA|nr:unnamed protein product [Gongylonema pulchrum]
MGNNEEKEDLMSEAEAVIMAINASDKDQLAELKEDPEFSEIIKQLQEDSNVDNYFLDEKGGLGEMA